MDGEDRLSSPDLNAAGLIDAPPDPKRYDWDGVFGADDAREVPAIVSRWIPEGARILDVGCGSGAMTRLVSRGKKVQIIGVEPDPSRSAAARADGLDVVTGVLDAELLTARGPFDVILFTDVLEHLPNPNDILELAVAGLKPGGVIVASVPNVAHWSIRLRLLFGRFDYADMGLMDATHLRWFTRKSFRMLFEAHGLKVTDASASAGLWLGEYARLPFKLLPRGLRRSLIYALTSLAPSLFGCQHIIRAQKVDR